MTASNGTDITKEHFKRLIQEVCYLIGYQSPPVEQLRLFWEKVRGCDLRDFEAACKDDDMLRDLTRHRNLCWPVLMEAIRKYQSRRIEEEQRKLNGRGAFHIPEDIRKQLERIKSVPPCGTKL